MEKKFSKLQFLAVYKRACNAAVVDVHCIIYFTLQKNKLCRKIYFAEKYTLQQNILCSNINFAENILCSNRCLQLIRITTVQHYLEVKVAPKVVSTPPPNKKPVTEAMA